MLGMFLDYGFNELDFWNMTLGEVRRALQSKVKVKKLELKERATFEYIQARLIAKGVGIAFGDKSAFPGLEESYPGIFTEQDEETKAKQEEAKTQLSVLRFKQFANFHNKKYEEVASENE